MTSCKRIVVHLDGWDFYHHVYTENNIMSLDEISKNLNTAILNRFDGKILLHDVKNKDNTYTCVLLELNNKRKYKEYRIEIINLGGIKMSSAEKEIIVEDKMLNMLVKCMNNKNCKCKHDQNIRCEGTELCNMSAFELLRIYSK